MGQFAGGLLQKFISASPKLLSGAVPTNWLLSKRPIVPEGSGARFAPDWEATTTTTIAGEPKGIEAVAGKGKFSDSAGTAGVSPTVVTLFSGLTVAGMGLDTLGANVPSPAYRTSKLYVPPGRFETVPLAEPLFNVTCRTAFSPVLVSIAIEPVGVPGPDCGVTVTFNTGDGWP